MRGILIVTTPTEPVLSPEPKEPSRFLAKLSQVQTQPAAHAPHVARFHIAVDIMEKYGVPYFAVISNSRRLFVVSDQSKSDVMEYVGIGYWNPLPLASPQSWSR